MFSLILLLFLIGPHTGFYMLMNIGCHLYFYACIYDISNYWVVAIETYVIM